ncbi:hypothetical protein EQ718_03520 [Paracoccus versutus]|nr:hypothetical protein [Paracoccus versutus]WEJ78006.1 hypothetical protein EQ718_03520 [Paracoccus versutus]
MAVIYTLCVYCVLRLAALSRSSVAVAVAGMFGVGLLIYAIIDIEIACSADPIYTPPACAEGCGEGSMRFACDGPMGWLAYLSSRVVGPVTAFLCSILTVRALFLMRRRNQEA